MLFLIMRKVGQQTAQPALVHVMHAGLFGDFLDDRLRLFLGADDQDVLAGHHLVGDELQRGLEHFDRRLQVDDVDAVLLAENIGLHLGVPAPHLMAEMDAGLQAFLSC